jgi:hypothetical protein
MKIRAITLTGLILSGIWILGAVALGGTIVGSRHDLAGLNVRGYGSDTGPMTGGSYNDYREACIYCHVPHNNSTVAPLWNRQLPNQIGYEMYSSPNFDSVAPEAPDGISLACLSCHDGSVAVDAVLETPKFHEWFDAGVHYRMSPEGGVGSDSCGKCHNETEGAYGGLTGSRSGKGAHDATIRYFTKDLRDDHPISVTYPTFQLDSGFNQPMIMKEDGGRAFPNGIQTFEGDKVQCASCHDPHDPDEANLEGRDPFLRTSNEFSALCLTCHTK